MVAGWSNILDTSPLFLGPAWLVLTVASKDDSSALRDFLRDAVESLSDSEVLRFRSFRFHRKHVHIKIRRLEILKNKLNNYFFTMIKN